MKMLLAGCAILLCTLSGGARADAVVTLCQQDKQPGAGVNLASAIAAGGHITFNCGNSATIRITANYTVDRDLRIDGAGAITLDASGASGVFNVLKPDVTLALDGLVFTGAQPGSPSLPIGGVVRANKGFVRITTSTFTNNWTPIGGGALEIDDTRFIGNSGPVISANVLTLRRSRIENTAGIAIQSSGGIATIVDSDIVNSGTSVFTGGRVDVSRSRFTGNNDLGIGGGALHLAADATIHNTVFSGNRARSDGGAVFIGGAARTVTLGSVRFTGNVADKAGGAVAVEPLAAPARTIAIDHTVLRQNRAATTGGAIDLGEFIENDGILTGSVITFAGNQAGGDGGAIAGSNVAIRLARAVFLDNRAGGRGGAVRLEMFAPRPSLLANTLIARNAAPNGAGFVGAGATFLNSTIAGNAGTGLVEAGAAPEDWRRIALRNTLIAGNMQGNCASPTPLPPFIDQGNNLQFPGRSCPTSIPTADPWLDPLFIPVVGSPAFGHGENDVCAAAPVNNRDVYGQHRPQGATCTIGAVEGDLEKPIADRTVGGPAWPGSLGSVPEPGGGGSGSTPTGSNGPGSGGPAGGGSVWSCGCDCVPWCWWRRGSR